MNQNDVLHGSFSLLDKILLLFPLELVIDQELRLPLGRAEV
jgi:hypothetical protein